VHDEYRVSVQTEPERARDLLHALGRQEDGGGEHRVAVTRDDGDVFVYAESLEGAEWARAALGRAAAGVTEGVQITVSRWHPLEERWEDAAEPLPSDEQARAREHRRLEEREEAESRSAGYPEWEVRITLQSHEQARELAERLESEGLAVLRRWRHVMIGASDQDEAAELAERLRREAPAGSELQVEGTGLPFWNMLQAPARPFAFFGGLAG